MIEEAIETSPDEPGYQVTLIRMFAALGRKDDARKALQKLEALNTAGRLNGSIAELKTLFSQP
ncbi:hypothetical protein RHOFW104R3_10790 [Rhodanobacter denitrificans]|nr:hypothetical protein RHOFW104R3_10790 [Rhodanobacter denitrificans]